MADQAGTTLTGCDRCPEYSEIFPSDNSGTGSARWFGHDLSGAPDSGIGGSEDGRTRGGRIGRFGQSTFQPTFPVRRKRRAGGRVVTVSESHWM